MQKNLPAPLAMVMALTLLRMSALAVCLGTHRAAEAEYTRYDLNRNGVIDSDDMAYVLVPWATKG